MNKKVEDLLFYLSWRVVNSTFSPMRKKRMQFVINYLSSRRECWCHSSFPRDTRWAGGCLPETRTCTSPPPGPGHTRGAPGPHSSGGWSSARAGQTPDDSYPRDRGHYQESAWKSRFVTHSPAHGCWYFVNTGEISLRPCHISLNGWLGSYQSHVLVNVISLPKNKKKTFWSHKRRRVLLVPRKELSQIKAGEIYCY